jgi:hypothetical protein
MRIRVTQRRRLMDTHGASDARATASNRASPLLVCPGGRCGREDVAACLITVCDHERIAQRYRPICSGFLAKGDTPPGRPDVEDAAPTARNPGRSRRSWPSIDGGAEGSAHGKADLAAQVGGLAFGQRRRRLVEAVGAVDRHLLEFDDYGCRCIGGSHTHRVGRLTAFCMAGRQQPRRRCLSTDAGAVRGPIVR